MMQSQTAAAVAAQVGDAEKHEPVKILVMLSDMYAPVKAASSAIDSHLSNMQVCKLRVWMSCRVARQRVEFCLKATLQRCKCLRAGK